MFCSRCGTENPNNALYCNGCGGMLASPWPQQQGSWPTPPQSGWQQDPRRMGGGVFPPGLSKKKFARHQENSGSWAAILIIAIIFYCVALFMLFRRVQSFGALYTVMSGVPSVWFIFLAVELAVLVLVILAQIGLNPVLAWIAAGISSCDLAYGLVTFFKNVTFSTSMLRIIVMSYGPAFVWAASAVVLACLISSISGKYRKYRNTMRMDPF